MKFGTIGAGTVALAFAREALAAGHEVVLSSRRGPDSLASTVAELGRGASAASVEDAARLDFVLLAVPCECRGCAPRPAGVERPGADRRDKCVHPVQPRLVLADLATRARAKWSPRSRPARAW